MNRSLHCPICRAFQFTLLQQNTPYDVYRCTNCQCTFVHPFPSSEQLDHLYNDPEYFGGHLRGGYSDYDLQTEAVLPLFASKLDSLRRPDKTQTLLDYGCGFGTHLKLAAERGWKCFGVEISDHARAIAQKRLGSSALLRKYLLELVPQCYDVIIMFDVLEHLPHPRDTFYELFRYGCIGPQTVVLVTTPNAYSQEAISNFSEWKYFHPPYHLIYFSPAALALFFLELRFSSITVSGLYPPSQLHELTSKIPDLTSSLNTALTQSGGLLCEAQGSDFHSFMKERYVPGTWSAISTWEHLPRYLWASEFTKDKRVLDFGCGSGYGTALLAHNSRSVLGVDISQEAIAWARAHHYDPRLGFLHSDAAGLRALAPFDVITCFEVIEHIKEDEQATTLSHLSQLLAPDGILLISTPNPQKTELYGPNPHHLKELSLEEFRRLLERFFPYITIFDQLIHFSISFLSNGFTNAVPFRTCSSRSDRSQLVPACWVAICSLQRISHCPKGISFADVSSDPIEQYIASETHLNHFKMQAYEHLQQKDLFQAQLHESQLQISNLRESFQAQLHESQLQISNLRESFQAQLSDSQLQISNLRDIIDVQNQIISYLRGIQSRRIVARLLATPLFFDCKFLKWFGLSSHISAGFRYHFDSPIHFTTLPRRGEIEGWLFEKSGRSISAVRLRCGSKTILGEVHLKRLDVARVYPLAGLSPGFKIIYDLEDSFANLAALEAQLETGSWHLVTKIPVANTLPNDVKDHAPTSYRVRIPPGLRSERPTILHVIANFMLGGSSRLVVDLIEHLSGLYQQAVLTSYVPNPPAYSGLSLTELKLSSGSEHMVKLLRQKRPDLLHVHYWGDVDEPWYRLAFSSAEKLGIPVLQNINTPVKPFISPSILRNVYVSATVLRDFGGGPSSPPEMVIYPGSDLSHFYRSSEQVIPTDCIGMVYRLERDKLNPEAILPFIHCVRRRPHTRVLIVGGGSLLETFQLTVAQAGLSHAFEFPGYVSYYDLPAFYKRMTIFVAPVWKESFGQVSIFAMNMRLPVIGYEVGAIPEVIADPTLLAPVGDAEALGDLMISLLDDPLRRLAIGARNSERAKLFTVEAMVSHYRDLYAELLAARR